MSLAFVDIETTGLDSFKHEVLEVAILTSPEGGCVHVSLPIHIERASQQALKLNHYFDRLEELRQIEETPWRAAGIIADALEGRIFVGNNPHFDASFLEKLLRDQGTGPPTWHYHLVDVKSLVAGARGIDPPWHTEALSRSVGVKVPNGRHTAVADALHAKYLYEAIMGKPA